ncbi:MAG: hypothetical protein U5N85_18510 [Arcicella sp.]|nr:hypothetical protein [Arcicella sp.]
MKKIYLILTFLLCVYVQTAIAQMGVNSTGAAPATSSILDVSSTTKGFLMPRMTTTQRNAIPFPAQGLMIFNTTTAEIEVQRGLGWVAASRMAVPLDMSANTSGSGGLAPIIKGVNTGSGTGVFGNSATGMGIYGLGNQGVYGVGTVTGVFGTSNTGTGIFGSTDSFRGVWGRGLTTGDGVYGDAVTGNAVRGEASSSGTGGYFRSVTGQALDASTGNNFAIRADNNSASRATGSFFNIALGTAVKVFGGANALDITGGIKVTGNANNKAAFRIITNTAVGGNTSSNELRIPNTTLANSITDILLVTHNSVPVSSAFTLLDKAFGVYWNSGTSSWNIFLEDMSAMPNNTTFNVLVIKQ